MLGRTHRIAGAAAGAALAAAVDAAPAAALVMTAAGAAGALVPDLDEPGSIGSRGLLRNALPCAALYALACFAEAARRGEAADWRGTLPAASAVAVALALLPYALRGLFGHRGATHSLAAALAGCAAALLLAARLVPAAGYPAFDLARAAAAGLTAGWILGGIVPDACTGRGVPLLWPLTRRKFHLLPRALRIRTGGSAEAFLVTPLCLLLAAGCALAWLLPRLGVAAVTPR